MENKITDITLIESRAQTAIEDDKFYVCNWHGNTAIQIEITERVLDAFKFLESKING